MFQYKHGTITDGPVEVLVEYDKVEPFFTADFKQLMDNNEDYKIYDENIKPEPINASQPKPKPQPVKAAQPVVKKQKSSKSYNNYYHKKSYQSSKPKRTSRRHYNGAKRRSGYHGYSGKRSWSRRRR